MGELLRMMARSSVQKTPKQKFPVAESFPCGARLRQIGKYWQYLEDVADIQIAQKELNLLQSELKKNIEANPSIFNESKKWDLEGLLSSLKLSEGSF